MITMRSAAIIPKKNGRGFVWTVIRSREGTGCPTFLLYVLDVPTDRVLDLRDVCSGTHLTVTDTEKFTEEYARVADMEVLYEMNFD